MSDLTVLTPAVVRFIGRVNGSTYCVTWTPRDRYPDGWRSSYVTDATVAEKIASAGSQQVVLHVQHNEHNHDTIVVGAELRPADWRPSRTSR